MPASHFRNIVVLLSLHFPIRARPWGSHEGVGKVQRHLTDAGALCRAAGRCSR